MMKKITLLLSVTAWICAVHCKTSGNVLSRNNFQVDKLQLLNDSGAAGKIIFLTYRVSYDSAQQVYRFMLVNKQFSEGRLGPDALSERPIPEKNYFICEIKGSNNTQYIKEQDPLNREVEYPGDPTNDAALARTVITAPEGELTIRFQYQDDMQFLTIQAFNNNNAHLKTIYRAKF
ncbi:hypothetical protein ACDQ55_14440 [Chitinophaga sp. 30R24]|uniref:hypothetical protein n=1 Tax=Chitinophaga sp. 30R24 TaxID=3248838 RepID=UPI003B90EA57